MKSQIIFLVLFYLVFSLFLSVQIPREEQPDKQAVIHEDDVNRSCIHRPALPDENNSDSGIAGNVITNSAILQHKQINFYIP